jgi:hypothetical protein
MTRMSCDAPPEAWEDEPPIPLPHPWGPADQLTTAPPHGWVRVVDLPEAAHPTQIGVWLIALEYTHATEKEAGVRLHVIARDASARRILLVHPDLGEDAARWVEDFNATLTGEGCDCGGYNCLAGPFQFAAMQTRARRAWPSVPISRRIQILQEYEEPVSAATQGIAIVASFNDIMMLEEITSIR